MKIGDFKFISGGWGIAKERKGYAVMFGDDDCFAYVIAYLSRYQAKKEIKRIQKGRF
ncbi:hypothetical protein [Shewanella sp.]|uniref:hypothetical protein n=1 Tax=Shewanella sp. TaxID=50422 RepID=UPI0040489B8F